MSYDLSVYLPLEKMPTATAWRNAVIAAGFPVELDPDFDVEKSSGFRPAPVNGEMSGFEYYAWPVDSDVAHELKLVPENNFGVVLSCGHNPLERVSAFAAANALASVSGGLLVDPQSGASIACSDEIAWAQMQIAQILG